MKNKAMALLLASAMTLGLAACGGNESAAAPTENSLAGAFGAAMSGAGGANSVPAPAADAPAPAADTSAPTTEAANEYVSIEKTQTIYGEIAVPQFDTTKLDANDAKLANEMFANLSSWMQDRVEECKAEWGDDAILDDSEPLCETEISENGRILSVLVHYITLYPTSTSMDCYEAVNFDTVTGKAFDPHEVIKGVGFTEQEVKDAIGCYATRCHYYEWEQQAFYELAAAGKTPDGLGDPGYAWYEETEKLVDAYDAPHTPQGEAWDALPHYPTVYATEDGGLQVGFSVPTEAGAGYYDAMINIGYDNTETEFLNPNNPYGQPFGRGAMTSDAAAEGLIDGLSLDESYTVEDDSMALIQDTEGINQPCYVYRVSQNGGAAKLYAVSLFTGDEWEKDSAGNWKIMMNGTGLMPESVVTGARDDGVLAMVWNWPGDYGCWAANPRATVDMVAYGSDGEDNFYAPDCEPIVIYAGLDNTVVTFEEGAMEGDGFAPTREYLTLHMNSGDSVVVYAKRPQTANQCIVITTPIGTGTYPLQFTDPELRAPAEAITSDDTAG